MTVKVALGVVGIVTTMTRSDVVMKLVMSPIVEWRLEVVAESRWNVLVALKEESVRGVILDTLDIPDDLEGERNGIVDEASPEEVEAELVVGKAGKGDVLVAERGGEVEAVAAEAGVADTAE